MWGCRSTTPVRATAPASEASRRHEDIQADELDALAGLRNGGPTQSTLRPANDATRSALSGPVLDPDAGPDILQRLSDANDLVMCDEH